MKIFDTAARAPNLKGRAGGRGRDEKGRGKGGAGEGDGKESTWRAVWREA